MPAGRPSSYTPEKADAICAEIANGSNLHRLSLTDGFPLRETMVKWLTDYPEFAAKYARARDYRADWRFDHVDQIIADMRAGVIDAAMARNEIDAVKWQAGKEAPKRYGDRLELAGDPAAPLETRMEVVLVAAQKQIDRGKE